MWEGAGGRGGKHDRGRAKESSGGEGSDALTQCTGFILDMEKLGVREVK